MPTTPRGLIYPDSGAHTRTWEHWQALAESADAAIGGLPTIPFVQAGYQQVAAVANTQVTQRITFPTPFATGVGAPVVVVSPASNISAVISVIVFVQAADATGFTVGVISGNSANRTVSWIALGTRVGGQSSPFILGGDLPSESDTSSDASSETGSESTS